MLINFLKAIKLHITTNNCALSSQSHATDKEIPLVLSVVINDSDTPLTVLDFLLLKTGFEILRTIMRN